MQESVARRVRTPSRGADPAVAAHIDPMSQSSDAIVVARVLSGDREAFGTLVDRHQDKMIAYARHMGFGPDEAMDIVQDGFIRAFRHLRRCGDPERFGGWLFKIVSNLCRTSASRTVRRKTESIDEHTLSLRSDEPDPQERVEVGRTRERIREALLTVPPDQREALVLMYLEGYSVAEIEELTGASSSAVKMRLKRGRDALERVLAPLFVEVDR
jgi:RNA polymerase sigma-70 factor, ECF subfamily